MFRAAVESAAPTFDAASFAELVTNNFAVAWILKSENANENLRKSYRGLFLADALKEYSKAGIQLLPPLLPSVVSEKVRKAFPGIS
jgi:3-deoxy-D-manno-octulosonic acid (KDO) 8-phosphate synthase